MQQFPCDVDATDVILQLMGIIWNIPWKFQRLHDELNDINWDEVLKVEDDPYAAAKNFDNREETCEENIRSIPIRNV